MFRALPVGMCPVSWSLRVELTPAEAKRSNERRPVPCSGPPVPCSGPPVYCSGPPVPCSGPPVPCSGPPVPCSGSLPRMFGGRASVWWWWSARAPSQGTSIFPEDGAAEGLSREQPPTAEPFIALAPGLFGARAPWSSHCLGGRNERRDRGRYREASERADRNRPVVSPYLEWDLDIRLRSLVVKLGWNNRMIHIG